MTIYAADYLRFDDEIIDYSELKIVVKSLLAVRSLDGSTVQDIKTDYFHIHGRQFPRVENMTEFLLSIPGIFCSTNENGTLIFNVKHMEKSQHILDMVQKQKPSKNTAAQKLQKLAMEENHCHYKQKFVKRSDPENMCFFEDNYQYLKSQNHGFFDCNKTRSRTSLNSHAYSPYSRSGHDSYSSENDHGAHLYDYQFIGDDFLLSVAKMELKCRFTPGHRILRSGLCISGQTIKQATRRILTEPYLKKKIIVNIGSVDILHGHDLIDIQHDFINLMNAFESRGIQPIVTTLAPLANYAHRPLIKYSVEHFNEFIRSNSDQWKVIDLFCCMVDQNGHILFECYQSDARYVTGSNQPHLFWNKLGRQRILKKIKRNVILFD